MSNLMFLGYNLHAGVFTPAIGPLANAKVYHCEIITIYDNTTCRGDVRLSAEKGIIGYVYSRENDTERRQSKVAHLHNPLGPARFHLFPLHQTSMPESSVQYWMHNKEFKNAEGFEKFDPKLRAMYESLGYTLVGNYIVRFKEKT